MSFHDKPVFLLHCWPNLVRDSSSERIFASFNPYFFDVILWFSTKSEPFSVEAEDTKNCLSYIEDQLHILVLVIMLMPTSKEWRLE